jgi:hypothetical protein
MAIGRRLLFLVALQRGDAKLSWMKTLRVKLISSIEAFLGESDETKRPFIHALLRA